MLILTVVAGMKNLFITSDWLTKQTVSIKGSRILCCTQYVQHLRKRQYLYSDFDL